MGFAVFGENFGEIQGDERNSGKLLSFSLLSISLSPEDKLIMCWSFFFFGGGGFDLGFGFEGQCNTEIIPLPFSKLPMYFFCVCKKSLLGFASQDICKGIIVFLQMWLGLFLGLV